MPRELGPIIVTSTNDIIPISVWLARYECEFAYGPTDTPRAKRRDLEVFREFLSARVDIGNSPVFDITHVLIADFVCDRLEVEAASTVQRRLATISHWARWVASFIPAYRPPKVRAPKPAPRPPRWLTPDQQKILREAAPLVGDTEFARARSKFCIEAMMLTGLRASELLNLYEHQVSFDKRFLLDVKRKGNVFADIPICDSLRKTLEEYLVLRARALKAGPLFGRWSARPTLPLVVSLRAAIYSAPQSFRMSYKSLWRIVAEVAEKAGIAELSPHMCRHTFGRRLYEATLDIALVAKAMSHSNTVTTLGYCSPGNDNILIAVNRMAEGLKK